MYDGANNEASLLFELSYARNIDVEDKTIISRDNIVYIQLNADGRLKKGISFLLSWTQIDTPNFQNAVFNPLGEC